MSSRILLPLAIALAATIASASPLQSASITTTAVDVSDDSISARPTPTRGYWTTEYTSCGMETCEIVYSTLSELFSMPSSPCISTTTATTTADVESTIIPWTYFLTLPRSSDHEPASPTPSSS
ncbi:hypothetical protein F5X96DRAFT_655099 [Biscogniauxia mediterranea]|nr:hypothetical protein F5X96DRAFT_655099 [Biscogniauxia mediterranea]